MNSLILFPNSWPDYELIDSGEGAKLERFGSYIISRPDPRALWKRGASNEIWQKADAKYIHTNSDNGTWNMKRNPPSSWKVQFENLVFTLRPTSFRHVGIFPEQAPNWQWIQKNVHGKAPSVLNLFGYTGGATLAAASAGARVTHVDSSKPTVDWANENAKESKLSDKPIRWIVDDAYKFVAREARRGKTYDAVIMDPPRFGRGTKGEIWKIEEDLPKLMTEVQKILSPKPLFVLLNAYTSDLSPIVLHRLLEDVLQNDTNIESGELTLKDTTRGKLLPSGIFARFFSN